MDYSGLKKKELKELKSSLELKLETLKKDIGDLENDLVGYSHDDQSAADSMDRSSFEEAMQRVQLLLTGKIKLKKEVESALQRIDDDTYGVCEETEEPIGFKRLKVQPWTRYSLEAQGDMERRNQSEATLRIRQGASMA